MQTRRRINPSLKAGDQTKGRTGKLRFRMGSTGALSHFDKTVA
jgi:hypothetical protein